MVCTRRSNNIHIYNYNKRCGRSRFIRRGYAYLVTINGSVICSTSNSILENFCKSRSRRLEGYYSFLQLLVLCEIVGKPGWWGLTPILMAIPIVNFIAWIPVVILFVIISLELGKAFGKDTVWSVFLLILFSLIGILILGFGSDKYQGPLAAKTPEAPAPQA